MLILAGVQCIAGTTATSAKLNDDDSLCCHDRLELEIICCRWFQSIVTKAIVIGTMLPFATLPDVLRHCLLVIGSR